MACAMTASSDRARMDFVRSRQCILIQIEQSRSLIRAICDTLCHNAVLQLIQQACSGGVQNNRTV
jgi:hypothetical protein